MPSHCHLIQTVHTSHTSHTSPLHPLAHLCVCCHEREECTTVWQLVGAPSVTCRQAYIYAHGHACGRRDSCTLGMRTLRVDKQWVEVHCDSSHRMCAPPRTPRMNLISINHLLDSTRVVYCNKELHDQSMCEHTCWHSLHNSPVQSSGSLHWL